MKKSILLFAFLLVSAWSFADKKPKTEIVQIKTSAICEMCKERIEKNLAFTKGVTDVNLNLDNKVVTVTYSPKKLNVAKIKEVITKTGYDADEVVADEKGYEKLPDCCKKDGMAHGSH